MTTNRPRVTKHGTWWRVEINGRMWSSTPRHAEAIERAHNIATHARRIRARRDINRIHASLERIKAAAERTEESSLAARYRTGPGRGMTNANRATIAQLKERNGIT